MPIIQFSSVQFSRSVVSDSLRPHESQHARPPCPSPTPGVHWGMQKELNELLKFYFSSSFMPFFPKFCPFHCSNFPFDLPVIAAFGRPWFFFKNDNISYYSARVSFSILHRIYINWRFKQLINCNTHLTYNWCWYLFRARHVSLMCQCSCPVKYTVFKALKTQSISQVNDIFGVFNLD